MHRSSHTTMVTGTHNSSRITMVMATHPNNHTTMVTGMHRSNHTTMVMAMHRNSRITTVMAMHRSNRTTTVMAMHRNSHTTMVTATHPSNRIITLITMPLGRIMLADSSIPVLPIGELQQLLPHVRSGSKLHHRRKSRQFLHSEVQASELLRQSRFVRKLLVPEARKVESVAVF